MPGPGSPDFERMLEELADTYPSVKEQALDLKDEVMDLMPEEAPLPEPELSLEGPEDEIELEL